MGRAAWLESDLGSGGARTAVVSFAPSGTASFNLANCLKYTCNRGYTQQGTLLARNGDTRTIYIDSFGPTDDHDSLRRTFSKFGKVNLVSLPRFPQSKKFKGFGFVEFSEQSSAEEAVTKSSGADLRGIRVMSKGRWLEMKEQLKLRLSSPDTAEIKASAKTEYTGLLDDAIKPGNVSSSTPPTGKNKKKKRQKPSSAGHIHFGDEDNGQQREDSDTNGDKGTTSKKQKV
ncbi:unnamed protein product [Phytophthora fragariaefolia]|uniref:Unnamed protein product n=1 Tax=Phytophthora fragariaefolia TaxID=1490495 RepID=A0A9W6TS52_9STRA|nr:unnamed protein product [Phytophthora fragariaefolia]